LVSGADLVQFDVRGGPGRSRRVPLANWRIPLANWRIPLANWRGPRLWTPGPNETKRKAGSARPQEKQEVGNAQLRPRSVAPADEWQTR